MNYCLVEMIFRSTFVSPVVIGIFQRAVCVFARKSMAKQCHIVVACCDKLGIGYGGELPWKLK